MFCEETDWLEQEFYTEKWNKISNLNIELSIQTDKFLNKYYMHFTGTGSYQTSQGQKVSAKKHLGNIVTIQWKVLVRWAHTHTHTHIHVDVYTQFYIIWILTCHLPNGFFAMIGLSASRGSDSPSALTAITRNLYSWPGWRFSTSIFGSFERPTGTHRPASIQVSVFINYNIFWELVHLPAQFLFHSCVSQF